MIDRKKIAVSVIFLISMLSVFLSQSRIPGLDTKAQMGGRTSISSIAFDTVIGVDADQHYFERVLYSSINWGYTNWKGMTFGLLFGAAVLTFVKLIPSVTQPRNSFIASLKGIVSGAPLGVCVNCATPVAHSMNRAGVGLETSLATLMSSPTLNVIVLTMTFSLLPVHMATIRLLAVLVFILICTPLIIKYSYHKRNVEAAIHIINEVGIGSGSKIDANDSCNIADRCAMPRIANSWIKAGRDVFGDYYANLAFVLKTTLPLMILAGFLGTLVIEFFPFSELVKINFGYLALIALSAMGTLLPVPIAFDVIIVAILLANGFSGGLAAALLFSLSIFSVYPTLIIAKNISKTLSAALFLGTLFAAITTGALYDLYDTYLLDKNRDIISKKMEYLSGEEILRIAGENCHTLEQNEDQAGCLREFIESDAGETITVEICKTIQATYANLYSACKNEVEIKSARHQSLKNEDTKYCKVLGNQQDRRDCQLRVIFDLASFGAENPSPLCKQLEEGYLVDYCVREVLLTRLDKTQDPFICEEASGTELKNTCAKHYGLFKAINQFDIDYCLHLEDSVLKETCYRSLFTKAIEISRDYSVCDKIDEGRYKKTCKAHAAKDRARRTGDPSACDLIENTISERRECIILATVKKIGAMVVRAESLLFEDFDIVQAKQVNKAGITVENVYPSPIVSQYAMTVDGVNVYYADYKETFEKASKFRRQNGHELGINNPITFDPTLFFEPFVWASGIASGDYNNDGWPDLVFSSNDGIRLYMNNRGNRFVLQHTVVDQMSTVHVFAVALVDINNDGWLDLFFSTYGGKNYLAINDNGQFKKAKVTEKAYQDKVLTMAPAFGDMNRDGYLDIVLGNWSYGVEKGFNPIFSQNTLLINNNGSLSSRPLREPLGETLSVLLSDIDGDAILDSIIANDVQAPNLYYYGTESLDFDKEEGRIQNIPVSSLNTMSVESGDFNNDLLLDLFTTDMSFAKGAQSEYCDFIHAKDEQQQCRWLLNTRKAVQHLDAKWCDSLESPQRRNDCLVAIAITLSRNYEDNSFCKNIPRQYPTQRTVCNNTSKKLSNKVVDYSHRYTPQEQSNKLLINTKSGRFMDVTDTAGVGKSYWSWNAQAADLDNDEWLDIYIANGYEFGTDNNEIHSNIFFHNEKGKKFLAKQKAFGLEDYINTPSYTYLDMDLDGDLDIVATGVMSTPRVFVNETQGNNSISFRLKDYRGNHFCIGCKIIISYGDKSEKKQIREIKLSGGFLSFNDTVAYFGLGHTESIKNVEIEWSTGERWRLASPLKANRQYIIERMGS